MFYDLFKQLADNRGVSVHRATQDIGLSKSTATKWKNTGATPQGDTLQKIASYFGVTVDYLLGNVSHPRIEISSESDGVAARRLVPEDELKKAPALGGGEKRSLVIQSLQMLPPEGQQEAANYIEYLLTKYKAHPK